jgi:predicted N-acetyltransferase YhbS
MGKIFRLSEYPLCFEKALALIESALSYRGPHSFREDFAPLVDSSNHDNCFIYVNDGGEVLAHIGVKEKQLSLDGQVFTFCLLGGIVVAEAHRGKGIFQELLLDVLAEKRDQVSAFVLWSTLEKLYSRYGFYLCGTQFEYSGAGPVQGFQKTRLHELSTAERIEVTKLFDESFSNTYLTFERTSADWNLVAAVTSADLYVRRRDGKITDYYFQNKGQDLTDVIYEYGTAGEMAGFMRELAGAGKLWTATPIEATEGQQFQFMLAPGDLAKFTAFIKAYTQGKFLIRNINVMKKEVFFDFDGETLMLEMEEFLRGVFGPGLYEELGELPPFFVSGLDSI